MLSIREEFEEELKKTRAYQEILQEGRQEGKLRAAAFFRELGVSDEVVAERLELPLNEVKKVQTK